MHQNFQDNCIHAFILNFRLIEVEYLSTQELTKCSVSKCTVIDLKCYAAYRYTHTDYFRVVYWYLYSSRSVKKKYQFVLWTEDLDLSFSPLCAVQQQPYPTP